MATYDYASPSRTRHSCSRRSTPRKLREAVRWGIVERPEDALAVVDRQRDDHRLPLDGVPEHGRGGLIDETGELADVFVANPEPGEHHRSIICS